MFNAKNESGKRGWRVFARLAIFNKVVEQGLTDTVAFV